MGCREDKETSLDILGRDESWDKRTQHFPTISRADPVWRLDREYLQLRVGPTMAGRGDRGRDRGRRVRYRGDGRLRYQAGPRGPAEPAAGLPARVDQRPVHALGDAHLARPHH